MGILIFSPIYVIFIWQFFKPKEALLNGRATLFWGFKYTIEKQKRKNFKEGEDVTEKEIFQTKASSVLAIMFLTIILIIEYLVIEYKSGF
ncbi:hypothetical protein [Viridibacillus arvi]|uniref:DUF3899 domain-containing protein n=1 Tax=Viridibacillus arvi TaxID=263475 RepID=A0A0M0LL49_9BACL|nr:hypothetical protein [Viridibacillus arvi]KOO51622.1 hypothetical protein AMD00_03935 [Viridibacillus arvi]